MGCGSSRDDSFTEEMTDAGIDPEDQRNDNDDDSDDGSEEPFDIFEDDDAPGKKRETGEYTTVAEGAVTTAGSLSDVEMMEMDKDGSLRQQSTTHDEGSEGSDRSGNKEEGATAEVESTTEDPAEVISQEGSSVALTAGGEEGVSGDSTTTLEIREESTIEVQNFDDENGGRVSTDLTNVDAPMEESSAAALVMTVEENEVKSFDDPILSGTPIRVDAVGDFEEQETEEITNAHSDAASS